MFINSTFKFQSYSAYSLQWPPIQFVTLSLLSIVCLSSMLQCVCLCHEFIPIQFALCHILWAEYRGGKLLIFLFVFCIYLQPMTSLSNLLWWLGRWSFLYIPYIFFVSSQLFVFWLCLNVLTVCQCGRHVPCVEYTVCWFVLSPTKFVPSFFWPQYPLGLMLWRLEPAGTLRTVCLFPNKFGFTAVFVVVFLDIFHDEFHPVFSLKIYYLPDFYCYRWPHYTMNSRDCSIFRHFTIWFELIFHWFWIRSILSTRGRRGERTEWLTDCIPFLYTVSRHSLVLYTTTSLLIHQYVVVIYGCSLSLSLSFSSLEAQRPYGWELLHIGYWLSRRSVHRFICCPISDDFG